MTRGGETQGRECLGRQVGVSHHQGGLRDVLLQRGDAHGRERRHHLHAGHADEKLALRLQGGDIDARRRRGALDQRAVDTGGLTRRDEACLLPRRGRRP